MVVVAVSTVAGALMAVGGGLNQRPKVRVMSFLEHGSKDGGGRP
jgi:hypothetical protein